jgi:hypothetical protein
MPLKIHFVPHRKHITSKLQRPQVYNILEN